MTKIAYPTINVVATGARIKKLRKEKGIKVIELSEFMGFSEPQAIYKWQRGETLPSVDNLFALSRILETSIEDILVGDDEMSSLFCAGLEMSIFGCILNKKVVEYHFVKLLMRNKLVEEFTIQ